MPELPEVEIVRRGLEPAFLNQSVRGIRINRSDLRIPIPSNFRKIVEGQRIKTLNRRGKYILAFLESGAGFVLHLGMSGRIHIYHAGEKYESAKHDHVVFDMDGGAKVVFNDPRRFGMLYLISEQNWQCEAPFNTMGPEPLSNDFSGPVLAQHLKNRRMPIKAALLNQDIVAGIGNIYACEALYEAGISPLRQALAVQGRQAGKLAAALRDVLNRALAAGGSSLKDYQHTDGQLGYFQHSFSVYDREGHSCPACDCDMIRTKGIGRIVQAGRSSFYCARKQK